MLNKNKVIPYGGRQLSANEAASILTARRHPVSYQLIPKRPTLADIARDAVRAFGSFSYQPVVYRGHAQLFTRKNG